MFFAGVAFVSSEQTCKTPASAEAGAGRLLSVLDVVWDPRSGAAMAYSQRIGRCQVRVRCRFPQGDTLSGMGMSSAFDLGADDDTPYELLLDGAGRRD